jgi:hypothetical protein
LVVKGQSAPEKYVKRMFQELMKKPTEQVEIFDEILKNPSLRATLFGINFDPNNIENRQNAFENFKGWVDTMDDKLFGFIVVR